MFFFRILIFTAFAYTILQPIPSMASLEDAFFPDADDIIMAAQRQAKSPLPQTLIDMLSPSRRKVLQGTIYRRYQQAAYRQLLSVDIPPHYSVFHGASDLFNVGMMPSTFEGALLQQLFPGDRLVAAPNRCINDPIANITFQQLGTLVRLLTEEEQAFSPDNYYIWWNNLITRILSVLNTPRQQELYDAMETDTKAYAHLELRTGVKSYLHYGIKSIQAQDIIDEPSQLELFQRIQKSETPYTVLFFNIYPNAHLFKEGELENAPESPEAFFLNQDNRKVSDKNKRAKAEESVRLMRKAIFAEILASALGDQCLDNGGRNSAERHLTQRALAAFMWAKATSVDHIRVFYAAVHDAPTLASHHFATTSVEQLAPTLAAVRENPHIFYTLPAFQQDFVTWQLQLDYTARLISFGTAEVGRTCFSDCVETTLRNLFLNILKSTEAGAAGALNFALLPTDSPARHFLTQYPTINSNFTPDARNDWAALLSRIPGVRYSKQAAHCELRSGCLSVLHALYHLLAMPAPSLEFPIDDPDTEVQKAFDAVAAHFSSTDRQIAFKVTDLDPSHERQDYSALISVLYGDEPHYEISLHKGHASTERKKVATKSDTPEQIVLAAQTPEEAMRAAALVRTENAFNHAIKLLPTPQIARFLFDVDDEDPALTIQILKTCLIDRDLQPEWQNIVRTKLQKLNALEDDQGTTRQVWQAFEPHIGGKLPTSQLPVLFNAMPGLFGLEEVLATEKFDVPALIAACKPDFITSINIPSTFTLEQILMCMSPIQSIDKMSLYERALDRYSSSFPSLTRMFQEKSISSLSIFSIRVITSINSKFLEMLPLTIDHVALCFSSPEEVAQTDPTGSASKGDSSFNFQGLLEAVRPFLTQESNRDIFIGHRGRLDAEGVSRLEALFAEAGLGDRVTIYG